MATYVRALDGVRGIAVLLVVLFHFGLCNAGWVGVQIFFVLSGFLITGILLEDRALPLREYLGRFYWRRSMRIFPLYLLFLAALAVAHALTGIPESFRAEWPYLLTYTPNFARALPADLGPYTVHLWSLAVEEQFYLVWPLVVFLLPRARFKAAVIAVIAAGPLIRLALFAWLAHGHSAAYAGRMTYVLPFSQLDAFATGAAVAVFRLQDLRRAGTLFAAGLGVAGLAGLGMLVTDHLWRGGADLSSLGYEMFMLAAGQYVWGYTLLNVVAALAMVCTLQRLPALRWVESPALVQVGKISYGVYVYHVPVLAAAVLVLSRFGIPEHGPLHLALFLPYLGLVLLVSWVSFHRLEKPFLRLKDLWQPRARTAVTLGRVADE